MSKHPFDWIIHAILCFLPIYFGWAKWFVVVFVSIMIEYEQWNYSGKPNLRKYIVKYMIGDLIADTAGIVLALLI